MLYQVNQINYLTFFPVLMSPQGPFPQLQDTPRLGRQLLVNITFEEQGLKKFNMIEEAVATEYWLYIAV